MSFLEQLRKDKMQSMRDKDKLRTGVISNMMSGIALAEKEEKRELTDDEALKFVQKELKQAKDTMAMLPETRQDAIDEVKQRMAIIEGYLPKQLTEEEIGAMIEEVLAEGTIERTPKAKGLIMKALMPKLGGRADGKTVNAVVEKLLKQE